MGGGGEEQRKDVNNKSGEWQGYDGNDKCLSETDDR